MFHVKKLIFDNRVDFTFIEAKKYFRNLIFYNFFRIKGIKVSGVGKTS